MVINNVSLKDGTLYNVPIKYVVIKGSLVKCISVKYGLMEKAPLKENMLKKIDIEKVSPKIVVFKSMVIE